MVDFVQTSYKDLIFFLTHIIMESYRANLFNVNN
jgi:hypothetical protein